MGNGHHFGLLLFLSKKKKKVFQLKLNWNEIKWVCVCGVCEWRWIFIQFFFDNHNQNPIYHVFFLSFEWMNEWMDSDDDELNDCLDFFGWNDQQNDSCMMMMMMMRVIFLAYPKHLWKASIFFSFIFCLFVCIEITLGSSSSCVIINK